VNYLSKEMKEQTELLDGNIADSFQLNGDSTFYRIAHLLHETIIRISIELNYS
jgi:hypothetical protein